MGLLDSEPGKRRLLTVELPVIERYNSGRDPDFKIQAVKHLDQAQMRLSGRGSYNRRRVQSREVMSIRPAEERDYKRVA